MSRKKFTDSWKYIGHTIMVHDTEDIPNGKIVLLMDHEPDCDTVYDFSEGVIEGICDEYTFDVIHTPVKERLELMYEGIVNQVIQLISEGWDTEKEHMDLTPYLAKVKMLEALMNKDHIKF